MNQIVLAVTGDVGSRAELIESLSRYGVSITDTVTPKTHALAVGPRAKEGKTFEAQLNNIPIVTPEYLYTWSKQGTEPPINNFLAYLPSDLSKSSRRKSTGSSSSSYLSPESKKRSHERISKITTTTTTTTTYLSRSPSLSSMDHEPSLKKPKLTRENSASSLLSSKPKVALQRQSSLKNELRRSEQTRSLHSASNSSSSHSNYSTHSSPASSRSSSRLQSAPKKQVHDSSSIRYASPEDPGSVVALEGLIGIGKSTLCNKLLSIYPDEVDVYREETNEKFLQLFYSDPQRYGFALQWGMLKSRIYQLRLAQHDTKHGRWPRRDLLFWDRSMIGDYTFALWNHLLGGISSQEMEAYESEFGGSINALDRVAFIKDIQLFVLMNDEPARCKTRVEVNRKNASEQGIPLSYYEGLDDIHFHMFLEMLKHKVGKVIIQPWGEYDDAEACRRLYEDVIHGHRECPSIVHFAPGIKPNPSKVDSSVLVYQNSNQIIENYNLIGSARDAEISELAQYTDVYVPRDIMVVDPNTKGIRMDHLQQYPIRFYSNEFKRIVLFHLGHFQNIHFYDSL